MNKLFIVTDTVSQDIAVSGNAVTAGVFIRTNSPVLARICPSFLQDFKLYEVGEFDSLDSNGVPHVIYCDPIYHSWDEYKFPEAPVKDMSPEEIKKLKLDK